MRISLITQDPFYGDDPARVSLARAINHAHAAPSDLVEDFVIAEVPLRIRHVDFSHYAFESSSRCSGFQSLAQETTHANSRFESHRCAALLAGDRLRIRRRSGNAHPVKKLKSVAEFVEKLIFHTRLTNDE